MKLLITIFCLLFFLSCEKETSQDSNASEIENIEEIKTQRITKQEVEAIDFLDYGLSSATKKAVSDWMNFSELESIIESIKNGDLSYFESDKEILSTFIKELKSGVPEKVTSPSITARLTTLETKFYKLKSAVKITTTPKTELVSSIKEFFQAASNLNLQMNKKLEKEAQNIFKSNL
jgi:hypothetical protein